MLVASRGWSCWLWGGGGGGCIEFDIGLYGKHVHGDFFKVYSS